MQGAQINPTMYACIFQETHFFHPIIEMKWKSVFIFFALQSWWSEKRMNKFTGFRHKAEK